jgi:hypothetical protein
MRIYSDLKPQETQAIQVKAVRDYYFGDKTKASVLNWAAETFGVSVATASRICDLTITDAMRIKKQFEIKTP